MNTISKLSLNFESGREFGELGGFVFQGFAILRWNDRILPFPFAEIDRFAHTMMMAFLLSRFEYSDDPLRDEMLIARGVLHFLRKLIFKDIKPQVLETLFRKQGQQGLFPYKYRDIELEFEGEAFRQIGQSYMVDNYTKQLLEDNLKRDKREDFPCVDKIIRAARRYTTLREACIIEPLQPSDHQFQNIKRGVLQSINRYLELKGLRLLLTNQSLFRVNHYFEILRFQQRWSGTYKVPRTSVLGHLGYVALLSWFMTHLIGSRYIKDREALVNLSSNTFWCALFHDLPEAVTRDIVDPVKKKIETKFQTDIKKIENEFLEKEFFGIFYNEEENKHLREEEKRVLERIASEIKYFIGFSPGQSELDEFSNRLKEAGDRVKVFGSISDFLKNVDSNASMPVFGKIIYIIDKFAAGMEAFQSIKMGVRSKDIEDGLIGLKDALLEEAGKIEMREPKLEGIASFVRGLADSITLH